jgi:hypothetical protein
MDNEIQQNFFLIISLIVIIIIKHNEFEETLITSYPTDLTYPIEQEENNILFLSLLCSQFHRIEVKECIDLRRISRSISQAWFYEICMNMQDFEFKRHFRMTRSTFEWLCCEIIPLLRRDNNNPGPGIIGLAWEQKIGASLWFLATGESFRSIGERFGMGESTISYALRDFFDVIIEKFLVEKIRFPNTELEINKITNGFKKLGRISNVIGIIDGSHIPVKAPHLFPIDYFNRKGYYSIVLQAVVDHKKKFLDICVGWPGSTHDSRILVNSDLYNQFNNQNNLGAIFFNKYILGDGGYPNLSWLVIPYKDTGRGLVQKQTYFNFKHSQTRIKVEQAFGLLKGRWRCLLHNLEVSLEIVSYIVTVCCILHNICEEKHDFLPPEEQYHDTETDLNNETNTSDETLEGNMIRDAVCDVLWNNHQRRHQ